MKTRKLLSILLIVVVVVLAIFAARSIMRPEKFRQVYELRKSANVTNLTTIRSAQAIYKNVYKKYASSMDSLVDFVKNGTVKIEKNVGSFPDTMSEAQAFKLGLIHKEVSRTSSTSRSATRNSTKSRRAPSPPRHTRFLSI